MVARQHHGSLLSRDKIVNATPNDDIKDACAVTEIIKHFSAFELQHTARDEHAQQHSVLHGTESRQLTKVCGA
ncbi:hypothetical protein D3C76_1410630 [compost metagenome]